MSVAFSAIAAFAIAAPGFIAWYSFRYDQQVTGGVHTRPPLDHVFGCLLLSAILQLVWIDLAQLVLWLFGCGAKIDSEMALRIVAGSFDEDFSFQFMAQNLARGRWLVLIYFVTLYGISFLIGYGSRYFILRLKLDERWPRFPLFMSESWHELFVRARDRKTGKEETAFTWVTFVTETSSGNFLYKGALRGFMLTPSRGLDRIVLYEVQRRRLPDSDTGCAEERDAYKAKTEVDLYYPVDAQDFVVDMKSVKNLAVFYVYFSPTVARAAPAQLIATVPTPRPQPPIA